MVFYLPNVNEEQMKYINMKLVRIIRVMTFGLSLSNDKKLLIFPRSHLYLLLIVVLSSLSPLFMTMMTMNMLILVKLIRYDILQIHNLSFD